MQNSSRKFLKMCTGKTFLKTFAICGPRNASISKKLIDKARKNLKNFDINFCCESDHFSNRYDDESSSGDESDVSEEINSDSDKVDGDNVEDNNISDSSLFDFIGEETLAMLLEI